MFKAKIAFLLVIVALFVVWNSQWDAHFLSFQAINSSQYYFKDNFGRVWYIDADKCQTKCMTADYHRMYGLNSAKFTVLTYKTSNFDSLNTTFATDANKVFYKNQNIATADAKSFKALNSDVAVDSKDTYIQNIKASDYFKNQLEDNENLKLLSQVNSSYLGKFLLLSDTKTLYLLDYSTTDYIIEKLEVVDLATFKPSFSETGEQINKPTVEKYPITLKTGIGGDTPLYIGSDEKLHYLLTVGGVVIAGPVNSKIDYKYIGGGYSAYDKNIYFKTTAVEKADINSFAVVKFDKDLNLENTFFAKDANHVFWGSKIVESADPKTFKVLAKKVGCAEDSKDRYFEFKKLEIYDKTCD
jgi:hypothetical protein